MGDLVVAYNSLQNVDDREKTVAEVRRVLTAAGRFCVCIAHPMSDAGRFESDDPNARFIVKGLPNGSECHCSCPCEPSNTPHGTGLDAISK